MWNTCDFIYFDIYPRFLFDPHFQADPFSIKFFLDTLAVFVVEILTGLVSGLLDAAVLILSYFMIISKSSLPYMLF